jgi:hypothetical protein
VAPLYWADVGAHYSRKLYQLICPVHKYLALQISLICLL